MMDEGWVLEVQGLAKRFGPILALRGVDLKLQRGQLLALFGPNGAGKTTLLKILATLIRPTSGGGKILGFDLLNEGEEIRKWIGMLAHGSYLYEDLTALENLRFYARMRGLDGRPDGFLPALKAVNLEPYAEERVRAFSSGMKRRLALARLLLDRPQLLLLDEPFTGLDQQAIKLLEGILGTLKEEGRSIIMATHSLDRGHDLSDRVAILSQGRLVFEARKGDVSMGELRAVYTAQAGEA